MPTTTERVTRLSQSTACPVPDTGGNGHHEEADETQRSPLSWAEFIAEEHMERNGRNRNPEPASTSLFEWALTLEQ